MATSNSVKRGHIIHKHPDSVACLKSELELFEIPPTQVPFLSSKYIEVHPTQTLDRGTPLEFKIDVDAEEYIDLSQSFLYTKSKIVLRNGNTQLPGPDANGDVDVRSVVYPINYYHATQFKNVEVLVSGTNISPNDNLYAYRAYIDLLLNYSKSALDTQFATGLFFNDDGNLDEHGHTLLTDADINEGALERFNRTKYSRSFECIGKIHADLFDQNKHIMGGTDLKIKLHRHDSKFLLMAENAAIDYNIVIEKAVLFVKADRILQTIQEEHALKLELSTREKPEHLKYYNRRIEMKYFTKSANLSEFSINELTTGQIPRRIVVVFVDSQAFNGHQHFNPLRFQHFKVRSLTLRANGSPKPLEKIEVDFENDNHLMGYLSLLHATGGLFENQATSLLPYESYKNGHTLFAFNLSPNAQDCVDQISKGKTELEIKLHANCEKSVTVIAYLEYDNVIQIDKDNNVVEQ